MVTLNTRRPAEHRYRLFGTDGSAEGFSYEGYCRLMHRTREEREGWQRVNISEVPETFLMAVDENTKNDQFCRTGGLILMRLPRKFAEQRQNYYKSRRQERAFAADVLQGVAGADAVQEDRGSRNLDGAEAGRALRDMSRS
jgi:hypothetical protein